MWVSCYRRFLVWGPISWLCQKVSLLSCPPMVLSGFKAAPKAASKCPSDKRQWRVCAWFFSLHEKCLLPFKVPNFPNCIQIYTSILNLNFVLICLPFESFFLSFLPLYPLSKYLLPASQKPAVCILTRKYFSYLTATAFLGLPVLITDVGTFQLTFYFFFPQDFKMGFKKILYSF